MGCSSSVTVSRVMTSTERSRKFRERARLNRISYAVEPVVLGASSHAIPNVPNTSSALPSTSGCTRVMEDEAIVAESSRNLFEDENSDRQDPQFSSGSSAALNNQTLSVSSTVVEGLAADYFQKYFLDCEFGVVCRVCERLWFRRDLRHASANFQSTLELIGISVENTLLCNTCRNSLSKSLIPKLAAHNGFR